MLNKYITLDLRLRESIESLKAKYPPLLKPFLNAMEEYNSICHLRESGRSLEIDKSKYNTLCFEFAKAISECADTLGNNTIYVPYSMHYQIRFSVIPNNVKVVNFLKPISQVC